MEHGYQIKTSIMDGARILQEVNQIENDTVFQTIMRGVIDTEEVQIRQALISLGWTPPGEKHPITCPECGAEFKE